MDTYNLSFPDVAIDAILATAYELQNAGYIFRGVASELYGTPTERSWVLAGEGETGHGFTSPVPKGYIGVCVFNGTSWTGKQLKCVSIDSAPTNGSASAVSSGGTYASINQLATMVNEALDNLTFTDSTPSAFLGEYITEKVSTTNGGIERILTYFTILAATAEKAGLLSAADKQKIDSFLGIVRSLEIDDTTAYADLGTKIVESIKATIGGQEETISTFQLLAATASKAGLLSAADKQKVDAFLDNLRSLEIDDTTAAADLGTKIVESIKATIGGTEETISTFQILAATAAKAGLMSADDKAKLTALASEGYLYAGVATPSGTPAATTGKVFYLAIEAGTYTDYGGIVLAHGINIILYDESWSFVTLLVFDDEPTDGSHNLLDSGAVKDNTLEEKVSDVTDSDVAGYLIDKNRKVIAILKKNGAIERVVKNSEDLKIEELENQLSYISSEIDAEGNAVWYLTDSTGKVIAAIDNEGKIQFYGGGGFDGEMTRSRAVEMDAVKVLTDNKGKVIGWITGNGKVHVVELEAEKLSAGDSSDIGVPEQFYDMMAFLANGTEMKKFVNDKSYNLLYSMKKGKYHRDGAHINTVPTILIHDDDTVDYQLPTSRLSDATAETQPTTTTRGGYASILLPIILALNAKHEGEINAENGRITIGLAAEGQRVGLTPLYAHEDVFDGHLNNNGEVVKMIAEREGWNVICHSMTARYLRPNFVVDGLDSEFADIVLANGEWGGDLYWSTTTCYNMADGKNYQIKQDLSGWDELPPAYIKPYCAFSIEVAGQVYINENFQSEYAEGKRVIINPTYSVEFQVKTWFDRAKIAGLPFIDAGINWGSSHSVWHMKEDLKYTNFFFGRHGEYNPVPMDTNAIRFSYASQASRNGVTGVSHYNVYTELEYERLIKAIDLCIENNGLIVLFGHTSDASESFNYYFDDLTYPEQRTGDRLNYKDDNYPTEWIVPLKYQHLQEMLANEDSEYWTIPPLMRRNQDGTLSDVRMESWAEYYPCPGTTEAKLYDVIEYAISKGMRFATSKEAIKTFGNMFNIGVKISYGDEWQADAQLGNIPEENRSYGVIGADGSFNFNNV